MNSLKFKPQCREGKMDSRWPGKVIAKLHEPHHWTIRMDAAKTLADRHPVLARSLLAAKARIEVEPVRTHAICCLIRVDGYSEASAAITSTKRDGMEADQVRKILDALKSGMDRTAPDSRTWTDPKKIRQGVALILKALHTKALEGRGAREAAASIMISQATREMGVQL